MAMGPNVRDVDGHEEWIVTYIYHFTEGWFTSGLSV